MYFVLSKVFISIQTKNLQHISFGECKKSKVATEINHCQLSWKDLIFTYPPLRKREREFFTSGILFFDWFFSPFWILSHDKRILQAIGTDESTSESISADRNLRLFFSRSPCVFACDLWMIATVLHLIYIFIHKIMAEPKERTFLMIKPDGVQRGLVGNIIQRFEAKGFKLVAMKFVWVSLLVSFSTFSVFPSVGF